MSSNKPFKWNMLIIIPERRSQRYQKFDHNLLLLVFVYIIYSKFIQDSYIKGLYIAKKHQCKRIYKCVWLFSSFYDALSWLNPSTGIEVEKKSCWRPAQVASMFGNGQSAWPFMWCQATGKYPFCWLGKGKHSWASISRDSMSTASTNSQCRTWKASTQTHFPVIFSK